MQWYEAEVAALEARIRNGEIRPDANLFYGSSSFRLWNTLADDLAPHRVANVAFGGSTLEACVHFFERLVVPSRPAALFFYAGDNDLGDGKYYMQVIEYFEALLYKRARYLPETPLCFLSIKPSPARRQLIPRMRQVNAYVRDRLAELPGCTYIDIHAPMLDAAGMPDASRYSEDGLHMNASGYALWREILLQNATVFR